MGMLTEKEAAAVVCPMTLSQKDGGDTCLGSVCMAWRGTTVRAFLAPGVVPEGDGWTSDLTGVLQLWTRSVGYCGLAGQP